MHQKENSNEGNGITKQYPEQSEIKKKNEISGDCGEKVLNTFQTANAPIVQATYEVKAKMPLLGSPLRAVICILYAHSNKILSMLRKLKSLTLLLGESQPKQGVKCF